ncbi:hypothetical protein M422DRAFT_258154 [Sphaerobolus stellatus SS14]|uniref:Uncharacterized protein n=1 Tax=Sphaerobolus stellatus (strain SS14) TaxID=990650 RepID=A0A0C9VMU0_SPHS4|nr:hypothetical protein M422DRAFT_258154 [Sphaerobolus stellatus SS14]
MATLKNKSVIILAVFVVSSSPERVTRAVKALENGNFGAGKISGKNIDAKDQAGLKNFVAGLEEVDHIVWTSADIGNGSLLFPDCTLDDAKASFDIMFWGPLIVAQNAKFRPGGSLTVTGGTTLVRPIPGFTVGAAVVGAIDSMTRGLAVDLAPVRVNAIFPGPVETDRWKGFTNMFPEGLRDTLEKEAVEKSLVKHIGQPLDVAEAYLLP